MFSRAAILALERGKPGRALALVGLDELLKRDKLSLDLFWIKDKSLTDTDAWRRPTSSRLASVHRQSRRISREPGPGPRDRTGWLGDQDSNLD